MAEVLAGDRPMFDFTVPDELLREAVRKSKDKEVVADIALVPGTGEGKPPPLLGVLRSAGFRPLVLLTAAATLTGTIQNGIGVLGPDIRRSFHLSLAGLGALTFVAALAQIEEVNIGHSIISRAVFVGIERAVREMRDRIDRARGAA